MDDFNILEFKDKFIDDACELLDKLEADLLQLENAVDYNDSKERKELIESVFRAMHTLKGVSGMYGFGKIGEFTHSLENIYDNIRNDELEFSKQIFEMTFNSVDHIRNLLQDENIKIEINQIVHEKLHKEINTILNISDDPTSTSKIQVSNTSSQQTDTQQSWYIKILIDENIILRGIKLLSIFEELSESGQFRIIRHPKCQNEDSEIWGIYFSGKATLEDIEDVFMFLLDDCTITKISEFNIFNPNEIPEEILNENKDEITILEAIGQKKFDYFKKVDTTPQIDDKNHVYQQKDKVQSEIEKVATQKKYDTVSRQPNNRISVDSEKLDHLMYLFRKLLTVNSQLILSSNDDKYEPLKSYLILT